MKKALSLLLALSALLLCLVGCDSNKKSKLVEIERFSSMTLDGTTSIEVIYDYTKDGYATYEFVIEDREMIREIMTALFEVKLKDYPEELGDFAYASAELTLSLCRQYGIFGKDRLTVITFSTGICAWLRTRYTREDFLIHGFYPKSKMRGYQSDEPYKYYDEVCLFNSGERDPQGFPIVRESVVADKARFTEFALMGIKPCVYYRFNTDEEVHRLAVEYGALGFTSDDPDICGEILDRIGARPLKK
jgi:hypothetical protein